MLSSVVMKKTSKRDVAEQLEEALPEISEESTHLCDLVRSGIDEIEVLRGALNEVVTQYSLLHGEPLPTWIRNAKALLDRKGC